MKEDPTPAAMEQSQPRHVAGRPGGWGPCSSQGPVRHSWGPWGLENASIIAHAFMECLLYIWSLLLSCGLNVTTVQMSLSCDIAQTPQP